jgi:hypothetical protein
MGHESCATECHSNFAQFNVLFVELVKQYDAHIRHRCVNDRNPLIIGSLNEVVSMLADIKKYATFDKTIFVKCDITS